MEITCLRDLEEVSAGARVVVSLCVFIELEILDLNLVVEHRHPSGCACIVTSVFLTECGIGINNCSQLPEIMGSEEET